MSPTPTLRIFPGRVSDTMAQLYFEVTGYGGDLTLTGSVDGPYLYNAHTLPAEIPIRDLGPGNTVLAECVIPDPCIWTPDCPALYDVRLDRPESPSWNVPSALRFGITTFGLFENSIYLNSKRFVPRLIQHALLGDAPLEELRESRLGLYVDDVDDVLLAEASRLGIPVVLAAAEGTASAHLTRYPAILGVVSEQPCEPFVQIRRATSATEEDSRSPHARLVEVAPEFADLRPGSMAPSYPVIYATTVARDVVEDWRKADAGRLQLSRLRSLLDRLQSATATAGRAAGFVLMSEPEA